MLWACHAFHCDDVVSGGHSTLDSCTPVLTMVRECSLSSVRTTEHPRSEVESALYSVLNPPLRAPMAQDQGISFHHRAKWPVGGFSVHPASCILAVVSNLAVLLKPHTCMHASRQQRRHCIPRGRGRIGHACQPLPPHGLHASCCFLFFCRHECSDAELRQSAKPQASGRPPTNKTDWLLRAGACCGMIQRLPPPKLLASGTAVVTPARCHARPFAAGAGGRLRGWECK